MSRETDVRVDYKLVDITAAADGALSMPNIQPFSDFTELLDEEQAIRRWATVEMCIRDRRSGMARFRAGCGGLCG